jgi:hypothetical protein
MTVKTLLTLISGLCWTIVYIEGIRLGFRDRTYAIPFFALALNFSWELLYTVLGLRTNPADVQTVINGIWLLFDIGILYTYLKFGRKYFPVSLPQSWFFPWSILGLVMAFFVEYSFAKEFGQFKGGSYAAFLQNLLMSVLFITMLAQRGSTAGQSLLLAVSKWIGTLAPTIVFGVMGTRTFNGPSILILVTGMFCSVFDVIYIVLVWRRRGHRMALHSVSGVR